MATGGAGDSATAIRGDVDTAVIGNLVSSVTSPVNAAYGIYQCAFADHNKVYNAQTGIYNAAKYIDNLKVGCATPFSGGTGIGFNN